MPAPIVPAQVLLSSDQLQALAQRLLQGRWQAENNPMAFIEVQQIGDRVSVRVQALMQGRCALQWVATQQRLIGLGVWPSGTEAMVWSKRA
jgi:hypothetical protein